MPRTSTSPDLLLESRTSRAVRLPAETPGGRARQGAVVASLPSVDESGETKPRTACIAALVVDGGTSFAINRQANAWHPSIRELLRRTAPGAPRVISGMGPSADSAAIARAGTPGVVDLLFEGRAHVRFDARLGRIRAQTKAPALWAEGLAPWMCTWLAWCASLAGASVSEDWANAGWRTSSVELCSDFINFPLRAEDAQMFTAHGKVRPTFGAGGLVETIAIGSRDAAVSLNVENKTRQLQRTMRQRPERSIYWPRWSASGLLHGGDDVTRVELRLSRRGIEQVVRKHDPGFANPARLLDREALSQLWRTYLERIRLTLGDTTRQHRARSDPPWTAVVAAAGEGARLPKATEVYEIEFESARQRASRRCMRALQSYAFLLGLDALDPGALAGAAVRAVEDEFLGEGSSHAAYAERLRARHGHLSRSR